MTRPMPPSPSPNTENRLGARWVLAAAAVGLVAAGAVGGGLIAQHARVEAQSNPNPARSQVTARPVSSTSPQARVAQRTTPAATCATCGVVESVRRERRNGTATGVGAVAGGVLGGVLGNQIGGGNGRTVMTVAGAVGGGLAGNEIEKRQRATTVYVTTVRMDDGSQRIFTRSEPIAEGQRVTVEGGQLRLAQS